MLIRDRFAIFLQQCLPKRALSLMGLYLSRLKIPFWQRLIIRYYAYLYPINMAEALKPELCAYPTLESFFIRHLKPECRPIVPDPAVIVSPADGLITAWGPIQRHSLVQAKGHVYTLSELLIAPELIAMMTHAHYLTIYLAPYHYHRLHMPYNGQLRTMTYVSGQRYSVNPKVLDQIPNVLTKNERIICTFDSDLGPFVIVMVGAMLVGHMHTAWHGRVTASSKLHHWQYTKQTLVLNKGEEMGYFSFGSTVIVLFANQAVQPNANLKPRMNIQYGQPIATCPLQSIET